MIVLAMAVAEDSFLRKAKFTLNRKLMQYSDSGCRYVLSLDFNAHFDFFVDLGT